MSVGVRVFLGFFIFLVLMVIPTPYWLQYIKPTWPLLYLLYLNYFIPQYFRLYSVFILGLLLDVLLSSVLGLHGFAMYIALGMTLTKFRRFPRYSAGAQTLLIGFICLVYSATLYGVEFFLGGRVHWLMLVFSSMMSMLLWPWLKMLLDDFMKVNLSHQRSLNKILS